MDKKYWDRMAKRYRAEIFDVLGNDRKGLIAARIKRFGGVKKAATDYGCGPGRFVPLLSRAFGRVLAVDIAEECLARARGRCRRCGNVEFARMDLTRDGAKLPKVDFALSVNSLLMPSARMRAAMLDCMTGHIARGGHLVLVVPAMESAILAMAMLREWNEREGMGTAAAGRRAVAEYGQGRGERLAEGVVMIDGVATKHFLEGELAAMLAERGMKVLEAERIEYSWRTEFARVPRWTDGVRPWDWLVVATKNR